VNCAHPEEAVLCLAPLIPAGMEPFHWNLQEWTGIHRNGLNWSQQLNKNFIPLEWTSNKCHCTDIGSAKILKIGDFT